jgi:hypothetical protein
VKHHEIAELVRAKGCLVAADYWNTVPSFRFGSHPPGSPVEIDAEIARAVMARKIPTSAARRWPPKSR